ncbi:hypothetical protein QC762_403755 [Podospora pseudocomata]|uniref:Uncharacterized protein n=1 Tax=Podospora pseudocomata TaxID=2093779 RepID=A0ABR0GFA5_9PEZI|nr:hypothetical protein QC762_403755 [Podospora pseudocomata]
MEASHPGWNTSFHAQLVGMGITTSPKASVLTDEPESYGCLTDRVSLTWSREIAQGIDYLRRVSGMAKSGPGPGNCGRVSCNWNAAIWFCNDNKYEKEVEWNSIADGAEWVLDRCTVKQQWVAGVSTYTDGWNVRVRSDVC